MTRAERWKKWEDISQEADCGLSAHLSVAGPLKDAMWSGIFTPLDVIDFEVAYTVHGAQVEAGLG